MVLNNKIKGILSLIAGVLINLLIGHLCSFPNLLPYYKSFLYYSYNKSEIISEKQLYFIAPTGLFVHNVLPSLTGFLDNILGTRILTIISVLSLLGSQLIMYNFIEYYLLIISFILFGFSGSLAFYIQVKNCWKYFPNKKGLISGIICSSFGLSSFIFTSIADLIINREGKEPKNGYYSEEIYDKFLEYLKFYIICIIIMGSIASLLCFSFKEEDITIEKLIGEEKEELNLINIINDKNDENVGFSDEEKKRRNYDEKKDIKPEKLIKNNLTLNQSLLSLDFYKCLSIAGCTLIYGFLLSNTYRNFGKIMGLSDIGMQYLSKAFTLLNTFSRLGWGLIYDKLDFKIPYLFVCVNQFIAGVFIYLSSHTLFTYIIDVCCGVLSYAGHIILFPNLIHKKFGVENSVIIIGICGIFGGIACILGPILTLFIIEDKKDYLILYIIGVIPTIISIFLTIFIKINKN